jgi:hypothetical protein
MCRRDLMNALREQGVVATEAQVRWALTSGKVTRPALAGSLRFIYGQEQLEELRRYFESRSHGSGGKATSAQAEPA